ncbi:hypothetical protein [Amycolatopsis alkalitolerans]|uniref:Uncharacterized protein n=1 Tax=Amycolatopsis alkalitolerans TaxID=2547244 RepID=A0A5C4M4N9_9PSEU|nr:hypothetical protein [Amycolatopsis alkalitolerans]TNC28086.1 hypothetical protein FG385_06555 [Amycolatopsis alkalitolerans]
MTGEEKETGRTGLKPAQVAASALAAITAAFLGSTLGVAGTVVGAGIASIITTVGGELYLRSLRRTREAARKTASVLTDTRLRQETRYVEPPATRPANPLVQRSPGPPQQRTQQLNLPPQLQPTQRFPVAGAGQSADGERTVYIPKPVEPRPKPPWWRNRWFLIVTTSVAAFVIGMFALTGFEKLTGHAVSGGSGTTFSQVVGRSPAGTPTTTQETTTVTETPSSQPSNSTAPSTQQSQTPTSTTPTQQVAPPSSASQTPAQTPTESASPTSAPG